MPKAHAVEIRHLSKTYRNGVKALKNVDLTIPSGAFFGLLGLNGAGKSTLIGTISSLIKPGEGDIKLMGFNLKTQTALAKKKVGVVPQEFNLHNFERCEIILRNQGRFYGLTRTEATQQAQKLLKLVGLWDKRNKPSNTLSGGMKRRLMIARALVHNPEFLILDEPTAGVDVELRQTMWDLLRELNAKGMTILLTTHYLEEAQALCKELAIIHQGKIIEHGSTTELLNKLSCKHISLHLKAPLTQLPDIDSYGFEMLDDVTLKVMMHAEQDVTALIEQLQQRNIVVHDISVPSNQLELVFTELLARAKESG